MRHILAVHGNTSLGKHSHDTQSSLTHYLNNLLIEEI